MDNGDSTKRERWFDAIRSRYAESPTHRLFGFSLTEVELRTVTITIEATPETRNLYGGLHGGVVNTVIDSALLQSVRTEVGPDDHLTTVELKVNFLRPATGNVFACSGHALRVGGSVGVAEAKLRSKDGDLLAAGLGTIHIRRESPPR